MRAARAPTVAALLCLVAAPSPTPVQEQPDPTKPGAFVVGVVVLGEDREPVPGATVYVSDSDAVALTDSAGVYRLMLPAGAWTIMAWAPEGPSPNASPPGAFVTLEEGMVVRADIRLDRGELGSATNPFALRGLNVVARSPEADERLRSGIRFDVLDSEYIRSRENAVRHVGDLVRGQFPGVRVRPQGGSGFCIEGRRWSTLGGASCQPIAVVLDGALVSDQELLATLPVYEIEEIRYLGSIEGQTRYGHRGSSGVLVVTTRTGGGHLP